MELLTAGDPAGSTTLFSNASATITIKSALPLLLAAGGRKTLDALIDGMSALKTRGVNNETGCRRIAAERKLQPLFYLHTDLFDPLHVMKPKCPRKGSESSSMFAELISGMEFIQ